MEADFGKAFAIGIALNVTYVVVQALFGLIAHSLALLSDAGHNLSDVLGLLLGWAATMLARKRPTAHYTYGLRRSTILASLANATLLLVAIGCITWEAIRRFATQEYVAATTVIWVAACGVAVNWLTAMLFMAGRKKDLNVRGAFLHMVADAVVSAGVVVAGFLILLTGWSWLDPAVSLLINGVIVWSTWGLLRDSVDMAMDAVPPGIDYASVQTYFRLLPGIADFHHLHIWALSTTETALTVHLVKPDPEGDDALLGRVSRELSSRFGIGHATIQFERKRPTNASATQSGESDCVQKGSAAQGMPGSNNCP
ncbi:MAG TPA: cation diffusion facilitator family transporter [Chthoniobacterales bacterium]|nr:cation diffusion facilitator family transporter [Chthoniobacterales bacterium]